MFIVALFTITKVWEQPKYSSIDEWINKMWLHTHTNTHTHILEYSVQFSPVTQSLSRVRLFATLWTAARQASLSITNSQSFTQTHVHQVGDAIQPSHPLSSPSPPDPNPSQHQGLFQWVNSSYEVAKVLEFQLQHQYSATKRSEILPCEANGWLIGHYAKNHKLEKDKYCMFLPTCGILEKPNKWANPIKQKQSYRYREQIGVYKEGLGEEKK